jgi:hypothetical protein
LNAKAGWVDTILDNIILDNGIEGPSIHREETSASGDVE